MGRRPSRHARGQGACHFIFRHTLIQAGMPRVSISIVSNLNYLNPPHVLPQAYIAYSIYNIYYIYNNILYMFFPGFSILLIEI